MSQNNSQNNLGLLGAVSRISIFTGMSRVLGFVRDILLASVLGIGPVSDAFFVAFKLPNLFRRISAEGAMTSAFIPNYTRIKTHEGVGAAGQLASEMQTLLVWALVLIVVVFELFMPYVILGLAPGFSGGFAGGFVGGADASESAGRFANAIFMARITMPYLPMISLLALWIAIGNVYGRFALGAAMPMLMNGVMIGAVLLVWLVWPEFDQSTLGYKRAYFIAAAVALGGGLKLLVIGVMLRRLGYLPRVRFYPRLSPEGRQFWRRFWPAALGAAGMQLNLLVDTVLASILAVGAISQLYYADRIAQLPLGVVGIALGVVLLPKLSQLEQASAVDVGAVRQTLRRAMLLGMLAALPALAGIVAIAPDIIRGLFAYGAFDKTMVAPTAYVLIAYGLGIPAFILVKLFQPAFYAAGDTITPLRVTILSVVSNLILSILLMQMLGAAGLALATSISLWGSAVIFMILLVHRQRFDFGVFMPLAKIVLASGVMGLALLAVRVGLVGLVPWQVLLVLMLIAGAVYVPLIFMFGVWRDLAGRV